MKTKHVAVLVMVMCGLGCASWGTAATDPAPKAYGIDAKRPIIGGACRQCVWGPLAEVTRAAMKPYGYDVQVCYNCNDIISPLVVAKAGIPHELRPDEIALHDPPPPKGPVDFGISESMMLQWAYHGTSIYKKYGPMRNLRLIANVEDPVYLLIAAKKSSGISDLATLRNRKKPLIVMTDGDPWLHTVFEYYGITEKEVQAHGGKFVNAMVMGKESLDQSFDLIVSSLGSIGNNLESNVWTQMSEKYDLVYFAIPDELRKPLAKEWIYGRLVEVPYRYLRGIEQPLPTVGRSGEAIIARADTPEDFAYTVAKALDEHRELLKWSNRPYSIDPRTVWKNGDVPLHPGAERYYREVGYIK